MKRSHDRKLRERVFKPGDWVLRKARNFDNLSAGKFSENWEGPFIVDRLASKGSYYLKSLAGDVMSKAWNASHLRKFFR
ncbi:hypothetical protein IFM89_031049 [Coptis chinensis]|uniref:Uncharacterized protein n=1 Tax=Coptis chinensis TaxID=261450 RepID=A0A835H9Z7_9MAGN|nr:hypothetical protein IFM89_031049 [Coptis chinensis]